MLSNLKYFPELLIRFLLYKCKLDGFYSFIKNKKKKQSNAAKVDLASVRSALEKLGVVAGDTIMLHSALSNIDCSAEELVNFLKEYIGPNGNILMPTHPKLEESEDGVLVYDVVNSPSTVGYLTEVFRRSEGVKRSLHPFSSVSAWGKDRDYFLEGNLYEGALPHGENSAYHKLSILNGKVVMLGVTHKRATIRHVAEELADSNFSLRNFFDTHKVKIIFEGGAQKLNVRKTNLSKSQLFISYQKVHDLWLQNKLIKHLKVAGHPFSVINAAGVVQCQLEDIQQGSTSYPFAPKKK